MHSEKRSSAFREAQLGMFTGTIYGGTHTLTGHPLDTIKSKMQVQQGFTHDGMGHVASRIWKTEGIRGFFRGCIPPLWGSMVYRGVMISSYEFSYTWMERNLSHDDPILHDQVLGLRPIVSMSALFASGCRGLFESPIEYAKIMGQTGQTWQLKDVYRGITLQVARTTALMIPIFTLLDIARRNTTYMTSLSGNFFVTAIVSGGTYCAVAPLETLKNLAQTATPTANATFSERITFLGGYRGLFRGVLPLTLCGGLRNGCGMVAMIFAQGWATKLGLRDVESVE